MYYFITLLFVLLSAKASMFDLSNICWFLIDVVILWVGFEKDRFRKSDLEMFVKFALVYIAFCTVRSFFLVQLPLNFWLNDVVFLFKYVFTSFIFCAVLKDKAVYYLTKVMFQLAIISLPFYCLQLFAGDYLYAFIKALNLPHTHFDGYANMFVFTYIKQHATRNAGYSWEPGAFGFFLNLTLLLHLVTNNFTFDKRAKWAMVAIFTTLSTTTYVAFAFIILLYLRGRGVKFIRLLFFVGPFLCIAAFMLPFLLDKIVNTYNQDMNDMKRIQELSDWYSQRGEEMPLNRFASLLFIENLFGIDLIWGISNSYSDTIAILKNINISNGIFSFLAQFGLLGLGLLMYRSYLFFYKYARSVELTIYCLLVILVQGFGECIFVTSIIFCFLFLYAYAQPTPDAVELTADNRYNSMNAGSLVIN